MENKNQLSGKKRGAKKKPALSKKTQVSLYVEGSKILKFGNEEKMKTHLYTIIDNFGDKEIFFATPTPDAYDGKKMDKITHDEPAQWQEPKSTITGLPPKISDFDNLMDELNACSTIPQVEAVMKKVKSGLLLPREKIILEAHAKEISKDMFND